MWKLFNEFYCLFLLDVPKPPKYVKNKQNMFDYTADDIEAESNDKSIKVNVNAKIKSNKNILNKQTKSRKSSRASRAIQKNDNKAINVNVKIEIC